MNKKEFFDYIGTINKYMLLDRMKSDCLYWLGYGNKCNKYLWGNNPNDHIQYMLWLYDSFPDTEKPEWIHMADIIDFKNRMGA